MTRREMWAQTDKDEAARPEMGTCRGREGGERERHLCLRLQNVKASASLKVQLILTGRLKHTERLKGRQSNLQRVFRTRGLFSCLFLNYFHLFGLCEDDMPQECNTVETNNIRLVVQGR